MAMMTAKKRHSLLGRAVLDGLGMMSHVDLERRVDAKLPGTPFVIRFESLNDDVSIRAGDFPRRLVNDLQERAASVVALSQTGS